MPMTLYPNHEGGEYQTDEKVVFKRTDTGLRVEIMNRDASVWACSFDRDQLVLVHALLGTILNGGKP